MYLLSFVICFEGRSGRGWYERKFWLIPAMLTTAAMAWALFADNGNLSIYLALPIYIVGLFFGCVVCHGELARSKPSPSYLTHFYLTLAAGGALGGLLVGLVAPQVFHNYWEMPLAILGLAVLGVHACSEEAQASRKTSWAANSLTAVACDGTDSPAPRRTTRRTGFLHVGVVEDREGRCALGLRSAAICSAGVLQKNGFSRRGAHGAPLLPDVRFDLLSKFLHRRSLSHTQFLRNIASNDSSVEAMHIRRLTHGVITHGSQIMEPPQRAAPTMY